AIPPIGPPPIYTLYAFRSPSGSIERAEHWDKPTGNSLTGTQRQVGPLTRAGFLSRSHGATWESRQYLDLLHKLKRISPAIIHVRFGQSGADHEIERLLPAAVGHGQDA